MPHSIESGERFLQDKYQLSKSKEVEQSAKRTEAKTGEKIPPQKPEERIRNYLDRLQNIIDPPEMEGHDRFDRKERNLTLLKQKLYDKEVIKPKQVPESFFESIRQKHRDEGYGEIEIDDQMKKELVEPSIEDQKNSLDEWVDYLASDDAKFPNHLKYWVFRSILKMGRYDKEKEKFTERYGGTVSPFPELNQEALGLVVNGMEQTMAGETIDYGYDIQDDTKQRFEKALKQQNFAKLYGIAIEEFKPISEELLKETKGEWRKFPRSSDPETVIDSLKNHGTGWCIRGKSYARRYLENNDLEIYYSNDEEGKPTVPRVVIVSSGDTISEVRGVEKKEELDQHIGDVVQKKLETLPGGESFEKKAEDMKRLTAIYRKNQQKEKLTKEDLTFLYEIDGKIENFGYSTRDPRIKEIRQARDPETDASIVFECAPEQIAHTDAEISADTKAYIGPLTPGIFDKIQINHIEHIYTSFPESRIRIVEASLGGQSKEGLMTELKSRENMPEPQKIHVYGYARSMLESEEFNTLPQLEEVNLVKLTVTDLGFSEVATTEEIYHKAQELGLELCPAETGPRMRLDYQKIFGQEQPRREWLYMGMEPIPDSDGGPSVFEVRRGDGGGSWLCGLWARPGGRWRADFGFVFRLRKLET